MKYFIYFLLAFFCQNGLSQINLTFDAKQLTSMKLSDISEKSYNISLKIDSASIIAATDKYVLIRRLFYNAALRVCSFF